MVAQLVKKFLALMKLEVSITRSLQPLLDPVVSQIIPFPILLPYGYINMILPSTFRSFKGSFPFRFPDRGFGRISHLSPVCYMRKPMFSEQLRAGFTVGE
jgi:hypothetical protein